MKDVKKNLLLLLLGGVNFGCSYNIGRKKIIYKDMCRLWQNLLGENISSKYLSRNIANLYRSKLIKKAINKDGSITLFLTDKGKIKALTYKFEQMRVTKHDWDKKWRIVVFDIPEKHRWGRDSLRRKLRDLGFCELQKSVFIFPFECRNEIDFIVEMYDIRKFVRYGILETIDNEAHLKEIYGL